MKYLQPNITLLHVTFCFNCGIDLIVFGREVITVGFYFLANNLLLVILFYSLPLYM